jgi:hypothetical protein
MRITYISVLLLMSALAYAQKQPEPQKYVQRMPQWNEAPKAQPVRQILTWNQ